MKQYFVLCAVLVLSFSCEMPVKTSGNNGYESSSTGQIEKTEDLFVRQGGEENKYILDVNDKKYIKGNGYTVWAEIGVNASSSFEKISCSMNKEYGDTDAGYGIIFLFSDEENKEYLLTVLINNKQKYCIGRLKDSSFSLIYNWTQTESLAGGNTGNGNKISVEYVTEGSHKDKFLLKINGKEETYFSDSENMRPVFKNTKWGYAAVISPFENFNTSRVRITYRKQDGESE